MAKILLHCKTQVNASCLRTIAGWLRRDHNFDLAITSHWREGHLNPGRLIDSLPRSHRTLQGVATVSSPMASRKKWDLVLSPDLKQAGCRKATHRAYMFNGLSFRDSAISPAVHQFDQVWLLGRYQRDRFLEKGYMQEGDPRFQMVGFPKLDTLVDGSINKKEVIANLGLEKGKSNVLYAPSGHDSSLEAHGEAIVNALAGMEGVQVIVKLPESALAQPRWQAKANEWNAKPNIAVFTDPDVTIAMVGSDLLVTDHSSAGNEYTVLDQPIVFFKTTPAGMDQAMLERRPGVTVDRADALPEVVKAQLENPGEMSEQRKAMAAYLFHLPGTATLRAIEQVYALTGVDPFLPTKWAIDAANRDSAELSEKLDEVDISPFASRQRTP